MKKETALIVGIASGPRFELIRKLAQNGHRFIFVGPSQSELELAARDLRQTYRSDVRFVISDLANEVAASAVFREVVASGTSVGILVNNVSVKACDATRNGPPGQGAAIKQCYIEAIVRLTRLFLLPMIERGRGRVINTLSLDTNDIKAGSAGCLVARDFVLSLTQLLAKELANTGVDVTALYPDTINARYFQVVHFEGKTSPAIRPAATILAFEPSAAIPPASLLPELAGRFGGGFFSFGRKKSPVSTAVVASDRAAATFAPKERSRPNGRFNVSARGGSRGMIASRASEGSAQLEPTGAPTDPRMHYRGETSRGSKPELDAATGFRANPLRSVVGGTVAEATPDD